MYKRQEQYIPGILKRCKRQHLERTYEISGWKDSVDFIEMIARKQGRLLKGGEPDESGVSKQILNDFNRGKIPWFVPPPEKDKIEEKEPGDKKRPAEENQEDQEEEEKEQEEQEEPVSKKAKKE